MESLDQTENKSKPSVSVDRVSIGKIESEKVAGWLRQAQESSKGFMALSKSDLVNFLINEHKNELSSKELTQLRACYYDPLRHINWITQELKLALVKNDLAMVATLQNEIKGIELSFISHVKDTTLPNEGEPSSLEARPKRRQKRSKKSENSDPVEPLPAAHFEAISSRE